MEAATDMTGAIVTMDDAGTEAMHRMPDNDGYLEKLLGKAAEKANDLVEAKSREINNFGEDKEAIRALLEQNLLILEIAAAIQDGIARMKIAVQEYPEWDRRDTDAKKSRQRIQNVFLVTIANIEKMLELLKLEIKEVNPLSGLKSRSFGPTTQLAC